MANSHFRCSSCRQYFARDDAYYRTIGLSAFCSVDCYDDALEKQKRHRPGPARTQIVRRRRSRPKLDTKIRFDIRRRDGNRCRWCETNTDLQVHHVAYRSEGGSDEPHNLITLCLECHARAHSSKRTWQPILLACLWLHYVERRKLSVPETVRLLISRGLLDRDPFISSSGARSSAATGS